MKQPKWEEYMFYILDVLKEKASIHKNDIIEKCSQLMELTDEVKNETLPNTPNEHRYTNRAGWAITYLKQSGLIERVEGQRGFYHITTEGLNLYESKKQKKEIIEEDLEKYESYQKFIHRHRDKKEINNAKPNEINELTPDESLLNSASEVKDKICSELLEKVRSLPPSSFEQLVIDLMLKMGYGSKNSSSSGLKTGGPGDNGIDGIISQDKLGLDTIYIQAKRYKEESNVSAHEVRDFMGALLPTKSKKGVFITTSDFTKEAIEHVRKTPEPKVILINGQKLSELMYEHGIGVSIKESIYIKKIDTDYFEEE